MARAALGPEAAQKAHHVCARQRRGETIAVLLHIALHPSEHLLARARAQRAVDPCPVEVDEHRVDLVSARLTEHVVHVQVRMAETSVKGQADRRADRLDRSAARAGEVREELRQRAPIDEALRAEPQPPEGPAPPRDRGHGGDDGDPSDLQLPEDLQLGEGARRRRIAI